VSENRVADVSGHRYRLEPGDGTRYEFSLLDANPVVCSGVGDDGSEYLTLVIHSPGHGSYEVRKSKLRDPAAHYARYLMPHYTSIFYTLMAITLACSVLVDHPNNLEGAAEEMLRVPEFQ